MEAGGDAAGSSKRKICHGRPTAGYDHVDDVDEEKKMEIFCALISSTRDHILNNINNINVNGSSSPQLLIQSHWAAAPNNKKIKTAVDVDPDSCNNMYKAPANIINYHHKAAAAAAAAAAWQPSFQHEDFIKVDGDDKNIQSAPCRSTRSPRGDLSMIMTTRPPPAVAAAASAASPPPLMMVKQPNGDNKLADHHHHHHPKDALDLKLSL